LLQNEKRGRIAAGRRRRAKVELRNVPCPRMPYGNRRAMEIRHGSSVFRARSERWIGGGRCGVSRGEMRTSSHGGENKMAQWRAF